jgi:SAM-dependent MidA family methyltransferase
LRDVIAAAGGQISFAEYMQEALYAPGLGYYSAGSTKFGAAGDFVTAPEVSAIFGRVLARQAAEVLREIGDAQILEIGAGSGKLAVDVLLALDALDQAPEVYNILDVSADLQERQRAQLESDAPQLASRVRWIADFPDSFKGVVIANEVLDALPVERFVCRNGAVMQIGVEVSGAEFVQIERAAPKRLVDSVADIEGDLGESLPAGFASEVSLGAPAWIGDLSKSMETGAIFLLDYGVSRREYYASDRDAGWLRCHFRHHAHNDPMILPGIQDLTSWVDFSLIAAAAVDNGLDILGYQTQSQFLMGGGLEVELCHFDSLPLAEQLQLSGQVKTLTLPGEMGENFKCMALGRGEFETPSAFQFADRTQTL